MDAWNKSEREESNNFSVAEGFGPPGTWTHASSFVSAFMGFELFAAKTLLTKHSHETSFSVTLYFSPELDDWQCVPEVCSLTSGWNRKFVVPLPVSGEHVVVHQPPPVLAFENDHGAENIQRFLFFLQKQKVVLKAQF